MKENQVLPIVESYINSHGYKSQRIDTSLLPAGEKAPDFKINQGSKLEFYCEVKTPSLSPNPATGMYHWVTTVSKLRSHVHKAVKQFKDQDPEHKIPWVVFFTSSDFQLNWNNFAHTLQGSVSYGQQVIKDMGGMRFIKETNDDLKNVDLFIWSQVSKDTTAIYQMVFFINRDSFYINKVQEISNNLNPREEENIKGRNP